MIKIRIIIIIIFFVPLLAFASQKLKGYVYAPDQTPIIGAQIFWQDAKHGVATDENGFFEIDGTPHKDHMLHVTYVGYEENITHVDNFNKSLKIVLKESNELNEIVITKSVAGRITSRTDLLKSERVTVKELSRAACCSLGESFETNPSVDVSYSDAVTGAKQIQMLGLSGNYVQMLTENYPNFKGPAKLYGLDYIPGPWMEGIQISKGAASVKNGYESISGQVNVDYKKPKTADPLSLNLFLSDAMRVEGNADAAIELNEKLSTGIFAHYSQEKREHDANDDSFLDMPKRNQVNLMNRWLYQTETIISQAGVKYLNDRRTSGQTMHTITNYGNSQNVLNPYIVDVKTNRLEAFTKTGYIINSEKSESVALILTGVYHDQKSDYADNYYNVYGSNVYASLMYEKQFTQKHKLSTGFNYSWDRYNESKYITRLQGNKQPNKEATIGVYGEYSLNINDKLTFLAGLRADNSSLYDVFLTPRLHVKYNLNPSVAFRASAGKGYRSVFVMPENSYLLASSRTLKIDDNLKQESAWNYGLSGAFYIPIKGEELNLSAEWYYTDFSRQVVMDMDSDPHAVSFYNSTGRSTSNVFQFEASYPFFRGFTLLGSYRWMDTKANYNGKQMQKPLTSRYKALVTASYETPMRIWQFDFTTQFNGGGRMPTPDIERPLWDKNFKSFIVMNAQVTKFFRNWSIYLGGENLTNLRQNNPIVEANNPYGVDFDATMVWGPTQGRKFYLGFRYNINKL